MSLDKKLQLRKKNPSLLLPKYEAGGITIEDLEKMKFIICSPGNCGTTFIVNYIKKCLNKELIENVIHCHGDSNLNYNSAAHISIKEIIDFKLNCVKPVIITIYRNNEDRYQSHVRHMKDIPRFQNLNEVDFKKRCEIGFQSNEVFFKDMSYLFDYNINKNFIDEQKYVFYDKNTHFCLLIKFEEINNIIEIINEFSCYHNFFLNNKNININEIFKNSHKK